MKFRINNFTLEILNTNQKYNGSVYLKNSSTTISITVFDPNEIHLNIPFDDNYANVNISSVYGKYADISLFRYGTDINDLVAFNQPLPIETSK